MPVAKSPSGDAKPPKAALPEGVNSATKVNVAFPFSQIKVQEPSAELSALADLVGDLAELVRRVAPGDDADALVDRAQGLARGLH